MANFIGDETEAFDEGIRDPLSFRINSDPSCIEVDPGSPIILVSGMYGGGPCDDPKDLRR